MRFPDVSLFPPLPLRFEAPDGDAQRELYATSVGVATNATKMPPESGYLLLLITAAKR